MSTPTTCRCALIVDFTVLDLPQLYQRPSADSLLSVLDDLSILPPSWTTTKHSSGSADGRIKREIKSEGIPAYLTKIIGSPLAWIVDERLKEQIWEAAAQRLSERSGRTAMSGFTRGFEIHLSPTQGDRVKVDKQVAESTVAGPLESERADILNLSIHEPALSEDNLGLKTWAASFLLAQRLPLLKNTLLAAVESESPILELGSGTGLVGLAAAAVFQCNALLTDLPAIVPNLARNVLTNVDVIAEHNGSAQAAILDWTSPGTILPVSSVMIGLDANQDPPPSQPKHSFTMIMAADPIYSSSHPTLLVNAIMYHLSRESGSKVVIEIPLREAYVAERQDLKARMDQIGLALMESGEEEGFDDWTETSDTGEERSVRVRCWWGIWEWK